MNIISFRWQSILLCLVLNTTSVAGSTTATTTVATTQLQAFMAENNMLLTQFAVAGALGIVTDPIVDLLFKKNPKLLPKDNNGDVKSTVLYGATHSISNTARLYAGLVLLSICGEWFNWEFIPTTLENSAASIAFSVWLAQTLGTAKRTFFMEKVAGTKLGRVRLIDRLMDYVIWTLTSAHILNKLQFKSDIFQSFFAASGLGALMFSLASKDLAHHIVGGFILQAWDAFHVGDRILLGDGTQGTVRKVGLVETEIQGYDNIIIHLPNSQIINQRISNLSRTSQSRLKEMLRFSYNDVDKMPKILADIQSEIAASCSPTVITDGSKMFTAFLDSYQEDHVQVVVMCHFNVEPNTQAYYNIKEKALLAIAKAVSKNKVKFAIPTINYVNP